MGGVGSLNGVAHPMRNRPPVMRVNPTKVSTGKRLDPIEEMPAPSSIANSISPHNKRMLNVVPSRVALPSIQ